MPVTRADELDARPADNAKELLADYKRDLARIINDGFANGDNGTRVVELAELNGFLDPVKERLPARQQASVEKVARIFRNQLLQLDLGCGEDVNIHDAIAKLRGEADVGAAIVLVAEVATWAADALLAKYDIFRKVEG